MLNVRQAIEQGISYAEIGSLAGVSRQRIHQIAKKLGLATRLEARKAAKTARSQDVLRRRDEAAMRKYGLSLDTLVRLREDGAAHLFRAQRKHAELRGIEWRMTLGQWWRIWDESGKWEQRGRGAGQYVMSRFGDKGAYEVGNVRIATSSENAREARAHNRAPRKEGEGRGVYCLYPGSNKPWVAKIGNKIVGSFATESEGIQARACKLAEAA